MRFATVVLLLVTSLPSTGPAPRRIAVIAPMDIELEPLLERAQITERQTIAKQVHHIGRLGGRDVVLVRCGRSLVAAAAVAQAVVDHHDPAAIVVLGIAGGINPELGIAEVVVPERWACTRSTSSRGPAPTATTPVRAAAVPASRASRCS